MDIIEVKQGDTLSLGLQFSDDDGTPLDLSSYAIAAEVRDSAEQLVGTLSITTGSDGVASVSNDTSAWPLGNLRCDFKLTVDGAVIHSDTFGIKVSNKVTA